MVDCVTGFLFLICEFIKLMLRYSAAVATGDGVVMAFYPSSRYSVIIVTRSNHDSIQHQWRQTESSKVNYPLTQSAKLAVSRMRGDLHSAWWGRLPVLTWDS